MKLLIGPLSLPVTTGSIMRSLLLPLILLPSCKNSPLEVYQFYQSLRRTHFWLYQYSLLSFVFYFVNAFFPLLFLPLFSRNLLCSPFVTLEAPRASRPRSRAALPRLPRGSCRSVSQAPLPSVSLTNDLLGSALRDSNIWELLVMFLV